VFFSKLVCKAGASVPYACLLYAPELMRHDFLRSKQNISFKMRFLLKIFGLLYDVFDSSERISFSLLAATHKDDSKLTKENI